MARVVEPLRAMGATIDGRDDGARAPLVVRGGALRGIGTRLPVASAQVKSALMLAGLQARGGTRSCRPRSPRSHRTHARARSAHRSHVDGLTIRVQAGAPHAFDLDVPGDPSSAAFFVVAAAITPGSDVVLEGVSCNPTRVGFVAVLAPHGRRHRAGRDGRVGAASRSASCACVHRALHGTVIDGDEIPNVQDEIPALAVAAAFADGVTEIRDAAELAVKESNRIGTLRAELAQLGVAVEAQPDGLVVRGGGRARRHCAEPRRSSHRDGDGGRGQRARRRDDRTGLAGGRVVVSASSPPTSRG